MGPITPPNDRVALHIGRLLIQGETISYQLELVQAQLAEAQAQIAELTQTEPAERPTV